MYIYDLADITFFIKSLKFPTRKFNILDSAGHKLKHKFGPGSTPNCVMNSYFFWLPKLWNSIAVIDLAYYIY